MKDAFFTTVILETARYFLAYVLVRLLSARSLGNNLKEVSDMRDQKQKVHAIFRRLMTRAERVAIRKAAKLLTSHDLYDDYFIQVLNEVAAPATKSVDTGRSVTERYLIGGAGLTRYFFEIQTSMDNLNSTKGGDSK